MNIIAMKRGSENNGGQAAFNQGAVAPLAQVSLHFCKIIGYSLHVFMNKGLPSVYFLSKRRYSNSAETLYKQNSTSSIYKL